MGGQRVTQMTNAQLVEEVVPGVVEFEVAVPRLTPAFR
jgi:hypothetical protein